MFDNIGGKIKSLAKAICTIGIVVSIIVGVMCFVGGPGGIIYGVLIAGLGSLFSWIGSFFAYGFGELIEKTCAIEKNTRNMKANVESVATPKTKHECEQNIRQAVNGKVVSFGLQYTGTCEICGQTKSIRQVVIENEMGEKIQNICAQCISENYI